MFVSRGRPFDQMAMERATAQPLGGDDGLVIPVATAEDSIVAKLEWFRLTNETSERQWDPAWQSACEARPSLVLGGGTILRVS